MEGYSRKDPLSGDLHHYGPDGALTGYSRVDPVSGDLHHYSMSGYGMGPGGPSYAPEISPWEHVPFGWVPALWVLLTGMLFWAGDDISGAQVLVLPLVTWSVWAVAVRAWRHPILLGLLTGAAAIGLMVLQVL